jgi:15-cis-phytoene synthase
MSAQRVQRSVGWFRERASDQDAAVLAECRAILARNSRSFAIATRLLPRRARDSAAAVYAYCRRVDDAIDGCPKPDQARALSRLRRELLAIYKGDAVRGADQRAFQAVVKLHAIPPRYPGELIEGMAMDVRGAQYESLDDLILYCHRVAGVVGLMMCHVFGLTRDSALAQARDLGIAMQLTNICRDVAEDYALGRVYLPRRLLELSGCPPLAEAMPSSPWGETETRRAVSAVIRQLLAVADRYYHSGGLGISALPYRAGLAVRVAARLYRAIGLELLRRDCDPSRGRAVVSRSTKLRIVLGALLAHLGALPLYLVERLRSGHGARAPRTELVYEPEHAPSS